MQLCTCKVLPSHVHFFHFIHAHVIPAIHLHFAIPHLRHASMGILDRPKGKSVNQSISLVLTSDWMAKTKDKKKTCNERFLDILRCDFLIYQSPKTNCLAKATKHSASNGTSTLSCVVLFLGEFWVKISLRVPCENDSIETQKQTKTNKQTNGKMAKWINKHPLQKNEYIAKSIFRFSAFESLQSRKLFTSSESQWAWIGECFLLSCECLEVTSFRLEVSFSPAKLVMSPMAWPRGWGTVILLGLEFGVRKVTTKNNWKLKCKIAI